MAPAGRRCELGDVSTVTPRLIRDRQDVFVHAWQRFIFARSLLKDDATFSGILHFSGLRPVAVVRQKRLKTQYRAATVRERAKHLVLFTVLLMCSQFDRSLFSLYDLTTRIQNAV